jgi:hypothetical protein
MAQIGLMYDDMDDNEDEGDDGSGGNTSTTMSQHVLTSTSASIGTISVPVPVHWYRRTLITAATMDGCKNRNMIDVSHPARCNTVALRCSTVATRWTCRALRRVPLSACHTERRLERSLNCDAWPAPEQMVCIA